MQLAGLRSLLFGAVALIAVAASTGCENPFDPLEKSDKIQGLSYIDFTATWDRWDSDPEYDGVLVAMEYFNEFGDALSFHDKPHSVVIEFWTQKDIGVEGSSHLVQDELFFSKTVEFSNSDDDIRIPKETYTDLIPASIIDLTSGEAAGFMVVRVFPPEGFPRTELDVAQPDVTFFKPEVAEGTPNP